MVSSFTVAFCWLISLPCVICSSFFGTGGTDVRRVNTTTFRFYQLRRENMAVPESGVLTTLCIWKSMFTSSLLQTVVVTNPGSTTHKQEVGAHCCTDERPQLLSTSCPIRIFSQPPHHAYRCLFSVLHICQQLTAISRVSLTRKRQGWVCSTMR